MKAVARKKILCFWTLAIILVGVVGCMETGVNGIKPYEEALLAHIQGKYGETFEYVEPYLGMAGSKLKRILVKSGQYPNERIVVGGLLDDDDNPTGIGDNYMAVLFKEELIGKATEIAREVYGDQVLIDYHISGTLLPETFDMDTHFAEYTSSVESSLNVSIIIGNTADVKNKEADAERLRELLQDNLFMIGGVIAYCKDVNTFETLGGTDIQPYWSRNDWYLARGDFLLTSEYTFEYFDWR